MVNLLRLLFAAFTHVCRVSSLSSTVAIHIIMYDIIMISQYCLPNVVFMVQEMHVLCCQQVCVISVVFAWLPACVYVNYKQAA